MRRSVIPLIYAALCHWCHPNKTWSGMVFSKSLDNYNLSCWGPVFPGTARQGRCGPKHLGLAGNRDPSSLGNAPQGDRWWQVSNFEKAIRGVAERLDKKVLNKKQIEVAVGIGLDSVFLKLYKKTWANECNDPLTSESRIFFSVWINDSTVKERELFYNIHALKLRKLKGYLIESRKFADAFRKRFKKFEHQWKNVSVNFGPLTLMEGWLEIDVEDCQDVVLGLANNFLEIEQLVDETLVEFKR